jgi:hypothetical protein
MKASGIALFGCLAVRVASAAEGDLCSGDQRALFSCHLKNSDRIASVCASPDLGKESGFLQYRFGSSSNRIDLSFPAAAVDPRTAFKYLRNQFAKGGTSVLSFHIGAWRYSVFSTQTAYGAEWSQAGVIVRKGQSVKKYTCGQISTRTSDFFLDLGLPDAQGDVDYVSVEELMTG